MQKFLLCTMFIFSISFNRLDGEELKLCGVEWPPFTYVENGNIVKGISYEIYEEAFGRLKQSFRITQVPWARCENDVKVGNRYHAIIDNGPLEPFIYGKFPTGVYPISVYVRKDFSQNRFTWEEMKGKRIGMVRGYGYTEKILQFDGWVKDFAIADEQMIHKLKANRYDYILSDLFSAHILAQKVGIEVKMLKPPVDVSYTYLVFHKSKKKIAEHYDLIIGQMIQDGTMDKIYQSYGYNYSELMQLGQH